MNGDDSTDTTNSAENGANVGFQAGAVHNSNIYLSAPGDPPEKRYRTGVNYLNNGVPLKARELIDEAIANGHDNAEVRFHWVLAMLSKRSYRELSAGETAQLARLPEHLGWSPSGEWMRALETLCELFEHLDGPDRDPAPTLAKLRELPSEQRFKIEQHCDLVLTGGLKDGFWAETRSRAQREQQSGERSHRAWAYFKPDPANARARRPAPDMSTIGDRLLAVSASALVGVALAWFGWVVLRHAPPVVAAVYLVLLGSAAVAAKTAYVWRYRVVRYRVKERAVANFVPGDPPAGGFANFVDRYFRYCAHKYTPKGAVRSTWLAQTQGRRAALRDEVVELYREDRIKYERITWLIRHLVKTTGVQWNRGVLFAHRLQYRTPLSVKMGCSLSCAMAAVASWYVVQAAVQAAPLGASAAVLACAAGGRAAARFWWRILSERWRCEEGYREYERELRERQEAYQAWKEKLERTRPTDEEMAAWLRADRVVLIDEALQHYRLAWRDITAHTVVQTPVKGCKRARVADGPWRYSDYELQVFLITAEGVRELTRKLDVEHGRFRERERSHFRFDAVSSLRVVESGSYGYTLDLTLSNGPTRTIEVVEAEESSEQSDSQDDAALARISLDSAGFGHALHVLEGIAAEGKAWIHRGTAVSSTPVAGDGDETVVTSRRRMRREAQRVF